MVLHLRQTWRKHSLAFLTLHIPVQLYLTLCMWMDIVLRSDGVESGSVSTCSAQGTLQCPTCEK